MPGKRYRLVYKSEREHHVSSVVLSQDEITDHLDAEAHLHELTGWSVTRGDLLIVCRRGDSLRVIEAKSFDPFDDTSVTEG